MSTPAESSKPSGNGSLCLYSFLVRSVGFLIFDGVAKPSKPYNQPSGPQVRLLIVSCLSRIPQPVSKISRSSMSALSSPSLSGKNNKCGGAPRKSPSKPTATAAGKGIPSAKTFTSSACPSLSVSSKIKILLSPELENPSPLLS